MTRHPADETLAAFADGRLPPRAREEMIEHLASCDDCNAVYDAVSAAQEAGEIERPPDVIYPDFRNKVIKTLAVAAAATIVFFTPPVQKEVAEWRSGGVTRLVKASEGLALRPTAGRLVGFPHQQFDVYRGKEGDANLSQLQLQAAAYEVIEASKGSSVKALRAKGLGHLLLGERDMAVAALKRASDAAGGNDPLILSDLAAAYLESARFPQKGRDDLRAALETADRAWKLKKTPETAWNRAMVLEYAHDPGADAAWNDYLALDSTSPWAQEVRDKYLAPEL